MIVRVPAEPEFVRACFLSMDEEQRTRTLARIARQLGSDIPLVESDNFRPCGVCGQFYDVRDFTEVHYHDDTPHPPMKPDA